MSITIPPLSVMLLIVITAISVGHSIGAYIMNTEMNTLLEFNRIQLANHEITLKQIDNTEALDRTLLSQMRIDTAQSTENERTMFAYLDNVLEQTRNITENQERIIDLLENLNTTTTDK